MNSEQGRILRRTKGFYYVQAPGGGEVECKAKGSLFRAGRPESHIAVGDLVRYDPEALRIQEILPRKSFLSRSRVGVETRQILAANVDYLLITASVVEPPFRPMLVFRLLTAAWIGSVAPCVVITKTDLARPGEVAALAAPFEAMGLEVLPSSIEDREPNPRLHEILLSGACVLAGHSGAGKSSLLNRHFPGLSLKVGGVARNGLPA